MRNSGLVTFNLNGDPFSDSELRYGLEGLADHLDGYDKDSILDYIETMDDDGFSGLISNEEEDLNIAFEKIDKLQNLIDGIIVRNGINKTVAMEAKTIHNDLAIDIRKLSDQNTTIGLEFALGEMTNAKKGLIAVAIAAIAAIIYKIIKWFRGDKSGDSDSSGGGVSGEEKKENSDKATEVIKSAGVTIKRVGENNDQTAKAVNSKLRNTPPAEQEVDKLDEKNKQILTIFINHGADPHKLLDEFMKTDLMSSANSFKSYIETMSLTDSVAKDILKNGNYTKEVFEIVNKMETNPDIKLNTILEKVISTINKTKVSGTSEMETGLKLELTQLLDIINSGLSEIKSYYDKFGEIKTDLSENKEIVNPSTVLKYINTPEISRHEELAKDMVNIMAVNQDALERNIEKFKNLEKDFAGQDNDGTLMGVEPGLQNITRDILKTTSDIIGKKTSIDFKLNKWISAKDSLAINSAVGTGIFKEMFSHLVITLKKLNHNNLYDSHIKLLNENIRITNTEFKKHFEALKKNNPPKGNSNAAGDRSSTISKWKGYLVNRLT